LFTELDPVEDPLGYAALKKIDFRNTALFLASKEFDSAKNASNTLKENRERLTNWIHSARDKQISNIKRIVSDAVKTDKDILTMPYVRVNGKQTHYNKINELEFATSNMKRVPIAEYLSTHRKETNLHQSEI
jgi:hypothetical protein